MLARLMMEPAPRSAILGAIAATRKYADRTLLANNESNVATSRSAVGPNHENPALLTRTSTAPASPARRAISPGAVRSAGTNRPRPPLDSISWTVSFPRKCVAAVHDHV